MRDFHLFKSFLILILFLLPAGSLQAQDDPRVEYLRYDVDITLNKNGDLLVRETQQVRYDGEFSEGFAEIPLDYLTELANISVFGGLDLEHLVPYEQDGYGPDTFSLEKEGNSQFVDWEYEETDPGDELTFIVEYLVKGGLWIYSDADLLEWRAVPADRSGLLVPESRVTVNLPFDIEPDQLAVDAFGPAFTAANLPLDNGQQIIFTTAEPLPDGTPFQILVEFPHGLVNSVPQAWQMAEDEADLVYRILAVDVDMELDETGNLHISESQQVRVVEGTMYEGFRRFTWLFLEGLDQLLVHEGDLYYSYVNEPRILSCEDCFNLNLENRYSTWATYDRTRDEVDINDYAAGGGEVAWRFAPLLKGEETTFNLEYDAAGAVSINEDEQKLHWTILPGYDVPVEQATVRLSLPNRLGLEDVIIEGAGASQSADGDILLTLDEPATDWSIQVTMPAGTTTAEKPAWQSELEAVYADAEAHRIRLAQEKVVIGSGGIMALLVVALGTLAAWYLKGSRKWREIRGNYRTTPPSDLSPGLVAYLIDEKVTAKGALASLLHLATLGLVRIDLDGAVQLERISNKEKIHDDEIVQTPTGEKTRVASHIAYLYNILLSSQPEGKAVQLENLLTPMKKFLPRFYTKMGQDLIVRYHQQDGFQRSDKWPRRAFFIALALFVGLFILIGPVWNSLFITRFPSAPFVITMVILLFALLTWWLISSQRSESLSKSAQAEAKRWLGFKAYLQDIQQYSDLPEAQAVLDRYFDYALALDVDEKLLQQVKGMGGVVPVWLGRTLLDDGSEWAARPAMGRPYYVRPWYRRGSWTGKPSGSQSGSSASLSSATPDDRPPLQRLSDDLNGSLSIASRDLTGVLNTAVGEGGEPVKVNIRAFGSTSEMEWEPGTPVDQVVGDIMRKSQTLRPSRPSRSSGAGYRGGSGRSRSRSSSRSRSRSSSSRRSGGGGRRGFR